jgi:hypothetical protein
MNNKEHAHSMNIAWSERIGKYAILTLATQEKAGSFKQFKQEIKCP